METGHGRKREEPGRVEKGSVGKRMEPRKQEERGLFQGKEKSLAFRDRRRQKKEECEGSTKW